MKIAFVARESFQSGLEGQAGGLGRYAETMSAALAAQGVNVTVIAQSLDSSFNINHNNGINIAFIPKWNAASSISWRLRKVEAKFLATKLGQEVWADTSNKFQRALMVNRYLPLVQKELGFQFDIVEFAECGAEGLFYLQRNKRPLCVVRIHCPTQLLVQKNYDNICIGKRLLIQLERFSTKRSDVVTSPSQSAAEFARNEWKLTKKMPLIIPNLFNSEIFKMYCAHNKTQPFTIIFTGRLEKIKGLMHFPEILSRLSARGVDFQIRFIGRDTNTAPGNSSMKRWLLDAADDNLKQKMIFLGQMNELDMVDELNSADVGLYLSSYETFGYTALEAQACGVPVIATINCGIGELIIHNKTGYLVDPANYDGIVNYLHFLAINPELKGRMGEAASDHAVRKYSVKHGCSAFIRLYSNLVSTRHMGEPAEIHT